MVQVKITKCSWGYTKITAQGHASDSSVCAAVSALMWGLAGSLINLKSKPNINVLCLESGNFDIDISPMTDEGQDVVDTCFSFAHIGLAQVAKTYPNEVTIE